MNLLNVLDQPCAFKLVYDPSDHYVNDHCLIRDAAGEWHLFYIYFPRDNRRTKAGRYEYGIGHAVSRDLLAWRFVDIVLREVPGTWEGGAIYAPYVAQAPNGRYVMLYCGSSETESQQIGAALSDDLYKWDKFPGNPILRPSDAWANWTPKTYYSCRDAHVLRLDSGEYLCYYTAQTKDPDICCIAAASSTDLLHWNDRGPVFTAGLDLRGPGQARMESPGVFRIPSTNTFLLHVTHRWGVVFVRSADPLHFTGEPQRLGPYHASEIFCDETTGKWFITSCCHNLGALVRPGDPHAGLIGAAGRGLFLAGLTWIDDEPVVVDLQRHLTIS